MIRIGRSAAGFAAEVSLFAGAPASAGSDTEAARVQLLSSCGTCHTADPGGEPRQGPDLAGGYAREAGSLPDFAYSDALTSSRIVWTEETLDPWIENAQGRLPGTIMLYRQAAPRKRALIIDYLKSLGGPASD